MVFPRPTVSDEKLQALKAELNAVTRSPEELAIQQEKIEKEIIEETLIYSLFAQHASLFELLSQYKTCYNTPIRSNMVKGWLWNSYQGPLSEADFPEGEGYAYLGIENIYYNGSFKNGMMHGNGKLRWGQGIVYEGNFIYNCIAGDGTYDWPGGAKYIGKVFDGLPHGVGAMQIGKQMHTYDGLWVHGIRHGLGTMEYGKGRNVCYAGEWEGDRKQGKGQFLFPSRNTYEGMWSEGKPHGLGTQVQCLFWEPGIPLNNLGITNKDHPNTILANIYEGDWKEGFPEGSGKSLWTWHDKEEEALLLHNMYVGEYAKGQRSGRGTFYYASGAIFQGMWRGNDKEGPGVLTYENGKVHYGIFCRDHYEPIRDESMNVLVKEALDKVVDEEEDPQATKKALSDALMRFNSELKDIFFTWSMMVESRSLFSNPVENYLDDTSDYGTITKGHTMGLSLQGLQEAFKNRKKIFAARGTSPNSKFDIQPQSLSNELQVGIELGKDNEKDISKEYLGTLAKNLPIKELDENLSKVKKLVDQEVPSDEISQQGDLNSPLHWTKASPFDSLILEGQARAMSVEQFWRLCFDAHILEPGLGLAQVDMILKPSANAWDDAFDLYCPSRQLIQREVDEAFVKLALCKFYTDEMTMQKKVIKVLEGCVKAITTWSQEETMYTIIQSFEIQGVFIQASSHLQRLFGECMLESKCSNYCIKLHSLINFYKKIRPQMDVPPNSITTSTLQALYQYQLQDRNPSVFLDIDINYREFEISILQFAILEAKTNKILLSSQPHEVLKFVERTSLGGHLVSNFTKNNPTKQLGKRFQLNAYS
ncbi:unnamed protein product [Sphagnum jensenii]|uniref:Uncharacterized protein n=1 Tax=Sphagnum jensenii TaxID=128206 RepID=A0ABP0X024_9BRYO